MTLPFDFNQMISLLTLFAAVVLGYAELKLTMKSAMGRLAVAETKIGALETKSTTNALMGQQVEAMVGDMRAIEGELRKLSDSVNQLQITTARIDERMKLEHKS